MLRLYQPQLILLDNFLPDGKGLDLIRHAVSTNYKGRIIFLLPLIIIWIPSVKPLRLGVFDYLIKPVHYQRLQHTPERFARYRSSLRSSEQASQTHVDALFNIQAREQTEPAEAPLRGIDESTFHRVLQLFSAPEVVHTADSLARILGSSKTTARRYLEQGVKNDFSGSGNQLWQSRPTGAHLSRQTSLSGACLKHLLEVIADDHLPFFSFSAG